jgi:SAM-dependent methyltransferase
MKLVSSIYKLSQTSFAPRAKQHILGIVRPIISELSGIPRTLDAGCGPDSYLFSLGLDPVGIDISGRLIAAYHKKGKGRKACLASADKLPFTDASFDLVWSCGLLHHLSDEAAAKAVAEMGRVCSREGTIVLFDAVLPRSFSARPLAWLVRRIDRGRFMRTEEQVAALLDPRRTWKVERRTYTPTGLEGLVMVCRPDR